MHQQFIRNHYCPSCDVPAEQFMMPHSNEAPGRGALSIFFATAAPVNEQQLNMPDQDGAPPCESPSSSSAVDCTLSLGTPSTRHNSSPSYTAKPYPLPASNIRGQQRDTYPVSFDLLCTKQTSTPPPAAAIPRASSVLGAGGAVLEVGGDTVLLPRRCASCDTISTPLWRNGPRGPKSLCNACGIRYKKEERRAASSAAATQSSPSCSSSSTASSAAAHLETPPSLQQQHLTTGYCGYHHPWGYPPPSGLAAARKCPSSTIDLSAISVGGNGADPNMEAAAPQPYQLPWQQRFNVAVPPQAAEFTASSRFQDYSLQY